MLWNGRQENGEAAVGAIYLYLSMTNELYKPDKERLRKSPVGRWSATHSDLHIVMCMHN